MGNDSRILPSSTVELLVARLAGLPELRLPAQLCRQDQSDPSLEQRRSYLSSLLAHEPGVFLERHGEQLTQGELQQLDGLRWATWCCWPVLL
jgi:hypothetical protein